MTISQLEYFIAIDTHRHFAKAANACYVTQPTLSMQIKKLEEELGVHLFDRSKQPIIPTPEADQIMGTAKEILRLSKLIHEKVKEVNGRISGTIKIGVIPTIAPYLLPLFLPSLCKNYPLLKIELHEHHTSTLIDLINSDYLDAAIIVTPISDEQFIDFKLYYEPFVVYFSTGHELKKMKTINLSAIDPGEIWLLSEGHCFRNQVINLCAPEIKGNPNDQIHLQIGSIEMLRSMLDINKGITLLPELSIKNFNTKQRSQVRYFSSPEPVREVSLITRRHQMHHNKLIAIVDEIKNCIPSRYRNPDKATIIPL